MEGTSVSMNENPESSFNAENNSVNTGIFGGISGITKNSISIYRRLNINNISSEKSCSKINFRSSEKLNTFDGRHYFKL